MLKTSRCRIKFQVYLDLSKIFYLFISIKIINVFLLIIIRMSKEEEQEEVPGLTTEETDKIQVFLNEYFLNKMYDDNKSAQMINDVLERVMEILNSFKKPYKYIADCLVSQRVGAGFTNFTSAYYDKNNDGVYHFYFPQDKNQSGKDRALILVLVTIFVISFSK